MAISSTRTIVQALALICFVLFVLNSIFLSLRRKDATNCESFGATLLDREVVDHPRLAVAFAFSANQLTKAELSVKLWESQAPCVEQSVKERSVLVVYADVDWGGGPESPGGPLKEQISKTEAIHTCFSQVLFFNANISASDNVYDKEGGWKKSHFWTRGPNMVFYSMLFEELPRLQALNVGHLFWMEPDVVPIRQGWLEKLQYEANKGQYWVQGSSFRGKCLPQKDGSCVGIGRDIVAHVNGNGLWHVGDSELIQFMFEVANGKYTHWPFDLAPLMHMQRVWSEAKYRSKMHLYQQVDWVRNYGSYPFQWSEIPRHVYLVHYSEPALAKDVPDEDVRVPEQDKWMDETIKKENDAAKRAADLERQLKELQAKFNLPPENETALDPLPDDPPLTPILQKAANKKNQVVITLASANWTNTLDNFIHQAKKQGFSKHVIVISLDKETSKHCKKYKIGGVLDYWKKVVRGEANSGFEVTRADESARNGKFSILLRSLKQGYHVVVSDADVIWLRSPFSYFNNELDLQIQSDSHTGYRQEFEGGKSLDTVLNGGLHYSVARPRVVRFYEKLLDEFKAHPENPDDQEALQKILSSNLFNLRWRVLEPALFPNGVLFFEQGLPQSLGLQPIAIHNNWVESLNTATYRFQEANLWGVDTARLNATRGKKYMTFFDKMEDNGLNNQRQNLRTALGVAQLLGRTLILPMFHREHRKMSPVTLDYFFDYDSFSQNFPDVLPHSFLQHAFPAWETLPVQYINNGLPDPVEEPWWPRAKVFKTQYYHLGSSEEELLSWFGENDEPLLVFQSMLRRFGPFANPQVQDQFNKRIFTGVAPNQIVAEIRNHIAAGILTAGNSKDFSCLHLRRGDTFLKDHAEFEKSIPEIADILLKYAPTNVPLYICTDTGTEETRKIFVDAGFTHVYFIADFFPPWMRSYVELLTGKLNMRYGQIDQLTCSIAKTFVGNVYSTFTFHIAYLRQMYGFGQVCQDIYDRKLGEGIIFV